MSARDPILVFAERAQARAYLWAVGELRFREAFEPLLAEGVAAGIVEAEQACRSCGLIFCVDPGFCATCLAIDARTAPVVRPKGRREAPPSTYQAVLYTLKTRGSAALGEPRCRQRLRELSADQFRELVAALTRLKPRCPVISEELLTELRKRIACR